MDEGFNSNNSHTSLREKNVWSIVPVRKGCKRGQYRKQLRDCFDWTLYWQLNSVESLISAIKRFYGAHAARRSQLLQQEGVRVKNGKIVDFASVLHRF